MQLHGHGHTCKRPTGPVGILTKNCQKKGEKFCCSHKGELDCKNIPVICFSRNSVNFYWKVGLKTWTLNFIFILFSRVFSSNKPRRIVYVWNKHDRCPFWNLISVTQTCKNDADEGSNLFVLSFCKHFTVTFIYFLSKYILLIIWQNQHCYIRGEMGNKLNLLYNNWNVNKLMTGTL